VLCAMSRLLVDGGSFDRDNPRPDLVDRLVM
jgi:hypothetical protein